MAERPRKAAEKLFREVDAPQPLAVIDFARLAARLRSRALSRQIQNRSKTKAKSELFPQLLMNVDEG